MSIKYFFIAIRKIAFKKECCDANECKKNVLNYSIKSIMWFETLNRNKNLIICIKGSRTMQFSEKCRVRSGIFYKQLFFLPEWWHFLQTVCSSSSAQNNAVHLTTQLRLQMSNLTGSMKLNICQTWHDTLEDI